MRPAWPPLGGRVRVMGYNHGFAVWQSLSRGSTKREECRRPARMPGRSSSRRPRLQLPATAPVILAMAPAFRSPFPFRDPFHRAPAGRSSDRHRLRCCSRDRPPATAPPLKLQTDPAGPRSSGPAGRRPRLQLLHAPADHFHRSRSSRRRPSPYRARANNGFPQGEILSWRALRADPPDPAPPALLHLPADPAGPAPADRRPCSRSSGPGPTCPSPPSPPGASAPAAPPRGGPLPYSAAARFSFPAWPANLCRVVIYSALCTFLPPQRLYRYL